MDLDDILQSIREDARGRNIENLLDEIDMDEEINQLTDPRFFGPDWDDEEYETD
jgi:hypothetical protein